MHHRHSLRLENYNYAQAGAYFITIVTHNRMNVLGEITANEMILSAAGELACQAWLDLPNHYPHLELDEFIFMPNHLHAILTIQSPSSNDSGKPETHSVTQSLSEIVRGFKSFSARRINALFQKSGVSLWQRGYFDHIIRDEADLIRVRAYIQDNPRRWLEDAEYQG